MSTDSVTTVSVVVLAFGDEPYLSECVTSLLASTASPEVIVVDNGAQAAVAALPAHPQLRVVSAGENLGFAAGCNFGVVQATGDVIAFVNSDVYVDSRAVAALANTVSSPEVGLACAQVRLADEPELVNSVGNPITFLMFSWAGGIGSPAVEFTEPRELVGITGATFAVRREVWEQLGGFDPEFFAYGEDMELSVRTWLLGYELRYEPRAISWHHYDFGRNPLKMYLLERNRLMTLFSVYESATIRKLLPTIVGTEFALLVAATRDGWAKQKIAGWTWLWKHREHVSHRRRAIAATRIRSDSELLAHLQARLEPPPKFGMVVPEVVNRFFEWGRRRGLKSLASRSLGRSSK